MGQEQPVSCNVITGLEVSGINNKLFSLPEVYTQKKIPVTSDNIGTQEKVSKWPYLDRVKIPHIEANIDLLIGANESQVMEPWEIINSYVMDHMPLEPYWGGLLMDFQKRAVPAGMKLVHTRFLLGGLKNCSKVSIITTSVKTLLRNRRCQGRICSLWK